MKFLMFTIVVCAFTSSQAGVTDVPPVSRDDEEVMIESVTRDTFIPANLFDTTFTKVNDEQTKGEEPWGADTNPLFKVLRDFIFQAGDSMLEDDDLTEFPVGNPTEEIVKLLEKGLMEVTTMFLTPSDDDSLSTTSSVENNPDPIKVLKIEDSNFQNRIGMNAVDMADDRSAGAAAIANATVACVDCYSSLQTCVQQCLSSHNCNNVQRQARMCPPAPPRLCSFFSQWNPTGECKSDNDCKSPLLCCSDGCVQTCSPGVWRQ